VSAPADWLFDRPVEAPPIVGALRAELMESDVSREHALHLQRTVAKVLADGERCGEPWVDLQGRRLREMADRWAARYRLPPLPAPLRSHRRNSRWASLAVEETVKHGAVEGLLSSYGVTSDQTFNAGLAATVIAFQRRHGLRADGVVGPKTAAVLHDHSEAPNGLRRRVSARLRDDFINNRTAGAVERSKT
jgi:murein L,D-transpeptidase YcbB/YkuD